MSVETGITEYKQSLEKFKKVHQSEKVVTDREQSLKEQKLIGDIQSQLQLIELRKEYATKTYNFLKIWCITYWVFIFLYVSVFPLVIPLLAGLIGVDLSDMLYSTWGLAYSVGGVTTFVIGVFGYIIKGLFTKDNEVDNTKRQ